MKLYIETTSIPSIIKFVLENAITNENFEFDQYSDTTISPLSKSLLELPYITKVYISGNFVALQKDDSISWEVINEDLKQMINEAYESETIILNENKKVPITIYTELTPNPDVLKFVSNTKLVEGILEFSNMTETENSPLASQLFRFPFVKEVFITLNYISVTKSENVEWDSIKGELRDEISLLLHNGVPIIKDPSKLQTSNSVIASDKTYTENEEAIKALIDEYVKPAVAADGGNIELISYIEETQTVEVLLQGACSGCPSSTLTLKSGIENLLKNMMPNKIKEVIAING